MSKQGRENMKALIAYLMLDGLHHTAKAPMCQHHLWNVFCFVEVEMSGFSFCGIFEKPSGSGEQGHPAVAAKALSAN